MSDTREEALEAQLAAVQRRCTALLEEKRLHDEAAMVRQFHRASGRLVQHGPNVPEEAAVRLRLRLVAEEFFEMLDACFAGALQRQLIERAKNSVAQCVGIGPLCVDLPALVDACPSRIRNAAYLLTR